ncbi:unnamed protein product [Soboliphyme baturini]|uniref:Peptidase_M14 domain-containing protein n=1 Tax=Soboliphyme baturini TaxID=241478 RepID=A0A183J648_9BILA|nr:unnamed protein product [Soboliphyme baturini]
MFVFKIIPMINVDGVIHGSHRCSLSGEDLNRQWMAPNKLLHPSIYHLKNLLTFFRCIGKKPFVINFLQSAIYFNLTCFVQVYCDFHGHSRKKNVFMYGINPSQSWCKIDRAARHNFEFYVIFHFCFFFFFIQLTRLPESLSVLSPGFCLKYCSFDIKKNKEGSGRVAAWRDIGLLLSYTMEASFVFQGYQVSTSDLTEMGEKFIDALVATKESWDPESSPSKKYENVED